MAGGLPTFPSCPVRRNSRGGHAKGKGAGAARDSRRNRARGITARTRHAAIFDCRMSVWPATKARRALALYNGSGDVLSAHPVPIVRCAVMAGPNIVSPTTTTKNWDRSPWVRWQSIRLAPGRPVIPVFNQCWNLAGSEALADFAGNRGAI